MENFGEFEYNLTGIQTALCKDRGHCSVSNAGACAIGNGLIHIEVDSGRFLIKTKAADGYREELVSILRGYERRQQDKNPYDLKKKGCEVLVCNLTASASNNQRWHTNRISGRR